MDLCVLLKRCTILIKAAYTSEERRLHDNFICEYYHCSKLNHPDIVTSIVEKMIKVASPVKYLGEYIDEHLTWKEHV